MTESLNLAPAMSAVLNGHALPKAFLALALLSAACVLISLVAGWRQLERIGDDS